MKQKFPDNGGNAVVIAGRSGKKRFYIFDSDLDIEKEAWTSPAVQKYSSLPRIYGKVILGAKCCLPKSEQIAQTTDCVYGMNLGILLSRIYMSAKHVVEKVKIRRYRDVCMQ